MMAKEIFFDESRKAYCSRLRESIEDGDGLPQISLFNRGPTLMGS
jgi:hypothetical protein